MVFRILIGILVSPAVLLADGYGCRNVTMVTRQEWHARDATQFEDMTTPVSMVFIHHTAMNSCSNLLQCSKEARNIQDYHMITRGWWDIGYNFLVGEDGRVYEARGWDRVGAHTRGFNRVAVAVSVMGNFMTRLPVESALQAVHNIISCGVERRKLVPNYSLYGHRDAGTTACPGNALYALIRQWPHYDNNKPRKTRHH